MVIQPVDHDCVLKHVVTELSNKLAKMEHELAQLKKAHVGPKTESSKMPRVHDSKTTSTPERLALRARA